MIDRDRFSNLSVDALEAVAQCSEEIDCEGLKCSDCPFQLAPEKWERFTNPILCGLAYGKALYRRLTK